MRAPRFCIVTATGTALFSLVVGCGFRDGGESPNGGAPAPELVTSTEPGSTEVDRITWAVYRNPTSVDPITAGDYPEQTVTSLLCESLFRQKPDGTVSPGLATEVVYPDETTAILRLRDDVTFWDGSPLTAADVAYSIERSRDPAVGGYWSATLSRVEKVTATSDDTVTLELSRPDYSLDRVLSFSAGAVVSRAAVEAAGSDYGTPAGGAMCTGAYRLDEWRTGDVLTVVRNDDYWDDDVRPWVRQIDFRGIPDESTLAAALQTGEVDGAYLDLPLSALDQVQSSDEVNIYRGPSSMVDAFIVADTTRGVLQDSRVRRALSLAFDRDSYISSLYRGTAQPSRALGSPGTWGYEQETFAGAWEEIGEPVLDRDAAKALIRSAGVEGETLTIGMSSEINKVATEANALKSAAEAIGLTVELRSYSADTYISLFLDEEVRSEVDGFFTTNYPSWPDPAQLFSDFAIPGAGQDYGKYDNPDVASLLLAARETEDPAERAEMVLEAQAILNEELPWIPLVAPDTVLVLNKRLTGATVSSQHFFGPWALNLGGIG